MMDSTNLPESPGPSELTENSYILDPESAAEMSRLQTQDKMLTRAMGGLLPEISDLSSYRRVLDLASGPGDWAIDLAYAHPHLEVIGGDISQQMLSYATARRTSPNVSFQTLNILMPFDFPDAHFDLINARYISSVLPRLAWARVLQECRRALRPGGILRLTEPEMTISNSPALERYNHLITQALKLSGHSFSPDGRHIGIAPMLGDLLAQAGLINIQQRAFAVDGSAGSPAHGDGYENARLIYLLAQPYIMRMGLANQDELTNLYLQVLREIKDSGFRSITFNLVAWGMKVKEE